MADITLWGFDGSTYVRTVKMLLAEKGVTAYEQVPVNVLNGEPKSADHLKRHPFGKVPVLDHGDVRVIETAAICQYLDTVLPGPSLIPSDPRARAKMDMVTNIIGSYGYGPIVAGIAAYHLFPDFVGGKDETKHEEGLKNGRKVVTELMAIKGDAPWLAGAEMSVADLYLAPLMAYVAKTPHLPEFQEIDGFSPWWETISQRPSFTTTQPG
ncbi:glutathione S-transferase family protein [Jiella sp. MQZ9-1]|uniref:glutathione transferase n=1 Tax=Jiella flava TaxID=2816857 RepID=A0A939FYV1_9HYPH|nr:glutathione S-transferase family protein [Jiella flava]MBO0664095.1 glutathione S-transferase family protein [Jiella flava]MCD2472666.1 glutathione S-transferase family protein [Jiella flava]